MIKGEKRQKQFFRGFFVLFAVTLLSFVFNGCSRQMAGASFVQKNSGPIECVPEVTLPERSYSFASINTTGIDRYIPLVKKYSQEFGVDWILVIAVINQESRFNHEAVSYKGAYGLMQLMPLTQIELTEKLGVEEAFTPRNNIKAGVYHLKSLYSFFNDIPNDDRIRFTLAAYNAGLGRILDAQRIASYMGNDPKSWQSIQSSLSFLSKKSYTLHQRIWADGYPPSGYFRNWHQTTEYVDLIMKHYDRYSLALR